RGLAYKPVRAEVQYLLGSVWQTLSDGKRAEAAFHAAAAAADESRNDDLAARAKVQLVGALGGLQLKVAEALQWMEHAQAAISRRGGDTVLEAELFNAKGRTLTRADRWKEAVEAYEEALRRFQASFGETDPRTGVLMSNIGLSLIKGAQHAEALKWLRRAVA